MCFGAVRFAYRTLLTICIKQFYQRIEPMLATDATGFRPCDLWRVGTPTSDI
jgi:hypothetical protein